MTDLLSKITECGIAALMAVAATAALWIAWAKERRGRVEDLRRIAHLARGKDDDNGL